jgi:hypothetical protein
LFFNGLHVLAKSNVWLWLSFANGSVCDHVGGLSRSQKMDGFPSRQALDDVSWFLASSEI